MLLKRYQLYKKTLAKAVAAGRRATPFFV
ncbi:hypothetical protein EMIT0158MI4_100121 [Burkholderia ambifaria]